jgi:predicted alpha/beta-fold hydrolase
LQPFRPLFRNPHLLTIAANYWSRPLDERRFPVEARLYETETGVRVLVHTQRPACALRGQAVLVHGLEGSSASGYAVSLAHALLQAGYAVHRFNMRSCGGTEEICGRSLYHSGQTSDLLSVLRELHDADPGTPLYAAGFSLGGNVVLKLAGELGERGAELVTGVAAVSTPIDLAACARNLNKRANRIYANRFLVRLKQKVRLKERLTPGLFNLDGLDDVKSIYDFDNRFTAPSFGFGTADNYYSTQSAGRFLELIRVPALVIQAMDDPLIPFEVYRHPAFETNPWLHLVAVEHGGHVGFVSRVRPRFWLDGVLLDWMEETRNKVVAGSVL